MCLLCEDAASLRIEKVPSLSPLLFFFPLCYSVIFIHAGDLGVLNHRMPFSH